ncbi:hypothetical protein L6R49_11505 [Myxococcota bacterium]|nr:hypothetical protein [Myxococcota bacterium]
MDQENHPKGRAELLHPATRGHDQRVGEHHPGALRRVDKALWLSNGINLSWWECNSFILDDEIVVFLAVLFDVGCVAAGLEAYDGVGLLAHGDEGDERIGDSYTLVAQGFDCVSNGQRNNVHIEIVAMSEEIKRRILGRTKWSVL